MRAFQALTGLAVRIEVRDKIYVDGASGTVLMPASLSAPEIGTGLWVAAVKLLCAINLLPASDSVAPVIPLRSLQR
jgi:hypothetical protein